MKAQPVTTEQNNAAARFVASQNNSASSPSGPQMKTRPQLMNEIYQIIREQNVTRMYGVLHKHFPRCKGQLAKLSLDDLEKVIPLLKEIYQ